MDGTIQSLNKRLQDRMKIDSAVLGQIVNRKSSIAKVKKELSRKNLFVVLVTVQQLGSAHLNLIKSLIFKSSSTILKKEKKCKETYQASNFDDG